MKRVSKNLYQHENGTYYSLRRVGARQFKKSLGTRDRALAKGILRASQANTRTLDPTATAAQPRPDFLKALQLHEENSAFGSQETAINFSRRRRTLQKFCSTWEQFEPVAIWKKYDSLGFVSAPNQLRWYLRSFVEFCVDRSWLSDSYLKIVSKIPRKVVPPRRIQVPSPDSVRDLLLMCEADDLELGQFIRWLTNSGLRLSGAAGISWEDINFSAGEYSRKMKGGKVVVIPLLPGALELLKSRWEAAHSPKTGLVFSLGSARIKRVRRILRKYSTGLGLNLEHPHLLRHHFASVAFASGFSPGEVAQMLGHRDGGALALQVYGHVIPSQLKSKVLHLKMVA